MTFEPKPNIYGLQQDVLNLLTNVSNLMGEVKDTLNSDESSSKYSQYQQEINEARNNVEKLELRMAVVAPMKAGKSTIINAIIGDDLLPSRNAAMTTIPTEIVLKKELTQPVLILSERIREIFKECYQGLNKEIQKLRKENKLEEKTGQYPHLQELINEIHDLTDNQLPNFLNSERIEGKENIGKNLTSLNDIVRLASILAPEFDPIEKLAEVPRIETGFCEVLDKDSQSQQLGNLVIVDTPGPNEAGKNLKLSYVVQEQLEKCSVVLIVLDFTQLNNKAAEDVKRQIQPIIDLRGKENLYVLVNKIDQRKEKKDITSDGVKKFVYSDLNLKESENQDNIFEISAFKAFSATQFFTELKQNPNVTLSEMKATPVLAKIAFGDMWEVLLPTLTSEVLKNASKVVWNNSGFENFLSKAISALMENAAPKSIKSSLNISCNYLVSVRDEVKLRGSAISKNEEILTKEIEILEADLTRLNTCKKKLQEVDEIRASLDKKLKLILTDLKQDALVKIEMFYSEEEYNQANWLEKRGQEVKNLISLFLKPLGQKINSDKKETILEFETEQKAQQFIGNAIAFGKQRTESRLQKVRQKVQLIIENKRNELAKSVEKEAKPIIEKAKQRLKETFDVDLELSPPTFSSKNDLNINQVKVKKGVRNIDQGYENVNYTERHWWHWLWIVPKEHTKQVKKPDKKVDYYTVSLNDIIGGFNHSLDISINSINQQITKYLDEDFKQKIDYYFEKLDAYLTNYRDDIKQAQQDQKLSLEEQKKLTDSLQSIIPKVDDQVEELKKLKERTDQIGD